MRGLFKLFCYTTLCLSASFAAQAVKEWTETIKDMRDNSLFLAGIRSQNKRAVKFYLDQDDFDVDVAYEGCFFTDVENVTRRIKYDRVAVSRRHRACRYS